MCSNILGIAIQASAVHVLECSNNVSLLANLSKQHNTPSETGPTSTDMCNVETLPQKLYIVHVRNKDY